MLSKAAFEFEFGEEVRRGPGLGSVSLPVLTVMRREEVIEDMLVLGMGLDGRRFLGFVGWYGGM